MMGLRFGFGFGGFQIMFTIAFLMVFGIFAVILIRSITQWNKNNHSPRLTVPAVVVSRRTNVSHSHSGTHDHYHHSSTTYYVTFQVESGDRMELHMSGQEFGMLVEGDRGRLTFQGTRYLGFERM
jgi:hypothetical protein